MSVVWCMLGKKKPNVQGYELSLHIRLQWVLVGMNNNLMFLLILMVGISVAEKIEAL